MGVPYSALRNPGSPTAYASNKTAVSADVTFAGFATAFLILAISFFAILPGIRRRNRVYSAIRFIVGMFIGIAILLSIYGQEWEVASLHEVTTAYKAFTKDEIKADIGVKIGLTNVNVTLKALPEYPEEGQLKGERINYNERFTFCCNQGRRGFGRFAGRINREFREAQWKGLPYPILWIAEYFTLDAENILWGRSYRLAGFYTFMVMWTAFCVWVLALALSFMVIRYCGFFLVLTGTCLLSSNVIYATVRYGTELVIPFSSEHVLEFSKGGSFYLCLAGGIVSTLVGMVIVVLDDLYPLKTAAFFNLDPLQDYQDTFVPEHAKYRVRSDRSTGPEADNNGEAKPRPDAVLQRPPSVLNEDKRAEAMATEAANRRESEAYAGNMYINIAEMHQNYVPGRKALFQKNKPRRKAPSKDGQRSSRDVVEEDGAEDGLALQPLNSQSVSFSAKGMGSSARADDSVATDNGMSAGSIRLTDGDADTGGKEDDKESIPGSDLSEDSRANRLSEAAHDNEVDLGDESHDYDRLN